MQLTPRPSRTGFTILEILVAITLLGLALIPIFGMLVFGSRNTGKVGDIIIASHLASEKMELIKSKKFTSINMDDADSDGFGDNDLVDFNKQIYEIGRNRTKYETSGKDINGQPIIVYPEEFGRFTRRTTVEPYEDNNGRWAFKVIMVEVSWIDIKGEPVDTRVTLKTLVANEDLLIYDFK